MLSFTVLKWCKIRLSMVVDKFQWKKWMDRLYVQL